MKFRSKLSGNVLEIIRINFPMTIFYRDGDESNGSEGDYLVTYLEGAQGFIHPEVLAENYEPETPGATIAIHLDGLEKLERAHTLAQQILDAINRINAALA